MKTLRRTRLLLPLAFIAVTACQEAAVPTSLDPPGPSHVVVTPMSFLQVSGGNHHTCAVRTDGGVECWGNDTSGQSTPPAGSFTRVTAGNFISCGWRDTGVVECWGHNPPTGDFTQLGSGNGHNCVLRSSGAVECEGDNTYGQVTPHSGSFTQIDAGGWHTCAIRSSDGAAECWGDNSRGQITGSPTDGSATATHAGPFIQVSAGWFHTCALSDGGEIECWGANSSGESTPPSGTFAQLSAGDQHSCALRSSDNALECWGDNSHGQASPPAGSFTEVSAGGRHTCALGNNGVVECWGINLEGQTRVPGDRIAPEADFVAPTVAIIGQSFSIGLANARVPGWQGPVTFHYAFNCGNGWSGLGPSSTASCQATNLGGSPPFTVEARVVDQDGDEAMYSASVALTPPSPPPGTISLLFWDFENATTAGNVSSATASAGTSGISGIATQNCGGPAENLAGTGTVLMTRAFGETSCYPYIEFTLTQPASLANLTFDHIHNHNLSGSPFYKAQLQLDAGSGYVDAGYQWLLQGSNVLHTGSAAAVIALEMNLQPGIYRIRWVPRELAGGVQHTGGDYFGLKNVRLNGKQLASSCEVTSTGDSGAGTLRARIADPNCDQITFDVTGTITLTSGPLAIARDVTITGPGAPSLAVSGNGASRVFEIAAGAAVAISNLTVTGGSVTGAGGGILNEGMLALSRVTISGNGAWNGGGGGVANVGGEVTIEQSTLSGNQATAGGGFANADAGSATITNSTIAGNTADLGGGIVNMRSGSVLTLNHTTIAGNHSSGSSAGITQWNLDGGAPAVTNSKNSIIADNRHVSGTPSDCHLPTPADAQFNVAGVNYATDANCTGFTQVTAAALSFAPLAMRAPGGTQTYALQPGSVALDAAASCTAWNGAATVEDQRGVSRPQNGVCDVGAFELQPGDVHNLTVDVSGQGSVSRNPDRSSYLTGEAVQVTAVAASGWIFNGWSGDLSGTTNPATLTMNGDRTVTATFTQAVGPILTVTVSGQGAVTSSPVGINCTAGGGTCSASFKRNSQVTLTATPAAGWTLSGWAGGASGNQSSVQLRMNADKDVAATFDQPTGPVLSIDANGMIDKQSGLATFSGSITCSTPTADLTVRLDVTQVQGKGRNVTTVSGSQTTQTFLCDGTVNVGIGVTASSPAGSKFVAGPVTVTATAPGAGTVTQTVQLK